MADDVQRELETMIPELEDLQDRGIFSSDEIKAIVSKRRDFEYMMKRKAPRKEDYLRYIEYETMLENLRKKRKARKHIKKPGPADFAGEKRIHFIFERALRKFRGDFDLWKNAIKYSMEVNAETVSSRRLGDAVKLHPRHVDFWVMAANFQFEKCNDVSSARTLMMQGLRINANSDVLWAEYMRLESLFVLQVRKRRSVLGIDDRADESLTEEEAAKQKLLFDGTLLRIVYQNAIKAMPTSFELLKKIALALEPFFGTLIETMALDLVKSIWNEATAVDSIVVPVERCWEERSLFVFRNSGEGTPESRALVVLKEGLNQVHTSCMMEKYLNFLSKCGEPQTKRRKTKSAKLNSFEVAVEDLLNAFPPSMFSQQSLEIICHDVSSPSMLKLLFDTFPTSLTVGISKLSVIAGGPASSAQPIMNQLLNAMDASSDATIVSNACLLYLHICIADESLKVLFVVDEFFRLARALFKFGNRSLNIVIEDILNSLLDWVSSNSEVVDTVFKRITDSGVPLVVPLSCYEHMIELKVAPDEKSDLYKKACSSYSSNSDLWIKYIKYERENGSISSGKTVLLHAIKSDADSDYILANI